MGAEARDSRTRCRLCKEKLAWYADGRIDQQPGWLRRPAEAAVASKGGHGPYRVQHRSIGCSTVRYPLCEGKCWEPWTLNHSPSLLEREAVKANTEDLSSPLLCRATVLGVACCLLSPGGATGERRREKPPSGSYPRSECGARLRLL